MGTLPCLLFQFLLCFAHYHLAFSSSSSLSSFSSSSHPLCRHDQRSILLQFKHLFKINRNASSKCGYWSGIPSYPKTTSWNEGNATDCCSWDGITCNRFTGHVIGLDLSCSQLYGTIHPNSSLFQLSHLQRLNLAYNYFNHSPISYAFGNFPSLTHLNLSDSIFSGSFPSQISYLSKLISLDLSNNNLSLITTSGDNNTFPNLRGIYMSSCNIEVFPDFLRTSKKLERLDLSDNRICGEIPNWVGFIWKASLSYLNLSHNFLTNIKELPWE